MSCTKSQRCSTEGTFETGNFGPLPQCLCFQLTGHGLTLTTNIKTMHSEIECSPGLEPQRSPAGRMKRCWFSQSHTSPSGSHPGFPSPASSRSTLAELGAASLTYTHQQLSHQAFYRPGFWNPLWRALSRGNKAPIRGVESALHKLNPEHEPGDVLGAGQQQPQLFMLRSFCRLCCSISPARCSK